MENNVLKSEKDLLGLLNIYLEEWKHRDNIMWNQVFRIYYATLIITILPYIEILKNDSGNKFDNKICFWISLIMSFFFLYIGLAYGLRLKAIGDTYMKLCMMIEDERIRKLKIEDMNKMITIFTKPLSLSIPIILFFSLLFVNFLANIICVFG